MIQGDGLHVTVTSGGIKHGFGNKHGSGSLTTAHAVGGRRAGGAAFRGRQWSVDGVHKERAQQHAWPPRWGITSRPARVWGPGGVGGCAEPRKRPTVGPQHAAADL